VAVPTTAGAAVSCPSCGAKLSLKLRPRAVAEPPPVEPQAENAIEPAEPTGAVAEPRRKRGKKRKRRAKADEQQFKRWLIAGVAAGMVVVVLIIGAAVWLWGGRARNAGLTDDGGTLAGPPPYDPVPWSVAPGGAPPLFLADKIDLAPPGQANAPIGRRSSALTVTPLAGGQGDYLALQGDPIRGNIQVVRGRLDLKTGTAVEEHVLEDIVPFRSGKPNVFAEPPPAAVAPDGTLAAWRADGLPRLDAPRKDGKVMFWDKGSKQPRPTAGPACSMEHWFEWAANGKLLLVHGGKLTLWDVAAGKAVFEVGKGLQRPIVLAPSRQWVIVRVGSADPFGEGYLEVYDTATGEVRGRFGEGRMTALALSPDGTRLAGVQRINPYEEGQGIEVHYWDLKTGERQGVVRGSGSSSGVLRWWGPDHVLLTYSRVILHDLLFNLRTNCAEATVSFPPTEPSVVAYEWPPDGRPWWNFGDRVLFTLPLPPAQDEDAVFKRGSAVTLEVACGSSAMNRRVTAALTAALQREGFQVGPADWKLRITAAKENSGREMQVGMSRVLVPQVKGEVELVGPGGTSVQKSGAGGVFGRSKYFVGTGGAGTEHYEKYDFKGQDPSEAMTEEAWDSFVRGIPYWSWPRTVWQKDGKYVFFRELKILLPPFIPRK
jgi:hypothetical protein